MRKPSFATLALALSIVTIITGLALFCWGVGTLIELTLRLGFYGS